MSMNPKLEKYINYVIDDLVSKTDLDFEEYKVSFPWAEDTVSITLIFQILSRRWNSYGWFNIMMEREYGVHKSEYDNIYWGYMEALKQITKDYYENLDES